MVLASRLKCWHLHWAKVLVNVFKRLYLLNFWLACLATHMKYVGVYSFHFSIHLFVRLYVHLFVHLFVFLSQGQSFCVKVYKTSYFKDPLMDFTHIWHDGTYRSKVFYQHHPHPGGNLGVKVTDLEFS